MGADPFQHPRLRELLPGRSRCRALCGPAGAQGVYVQGGSVAAQQRSVAEFSIRLLQVAQKVVDVLVDTGAAIPSLPRQEMSVDGDVRTVPRGDFHSNGDYSISGEIGKLGIGRLVDW